MDPRLLLALSVIATGGLWLTASVPPRPITVADATLHEGRRVVVEGIVTDLRRTQADWTFTLVDGPHGLPVRLRAGGQDMASPGMATQGVAPRGDARAIAGHGAASGVAGPGEASQDGSRPLGYVSATGTLQRSAGRLILSASHVETLRPESAPVPLSTLAADPHRWAGIPVTVVASVKGDSLQAEGATLATGQGPWPPSGPVLATGALRFDPACACFRLDAWTVAPWMR